MSYAMGTAESLLAGSIVEVRRGEQRAAAAKNPKRISKIKSEGLKASLIARDQRFPPAGADNKANNMQHTAIATFCFLRKILPMKRRQISTMQSPMITAWPVRSEERKNRVPMTIVKLNPKGSASSG